MDVNTNPKNIDCSPSRPAVVKPKGKPLPGKPKTEVIVQMGPFTEGNLSTPDVFENLNGPKNLLVKPDTGEIGPFDPQKPAPAHIIRKFITVQAQDNDVPNELPRLGNNSLVVRETPPLVFREESASPNPLLKVEVIREGYTTSTVITKPGEPVLVVQEAPPAPPPPPPAACDCPPKPCEPPPPVAPQTCEKMLKAEPDCASTDSCKSVVIDVLKNDIGHGSLCITSACALKGTVEIKDGKLLYTPDEKFTGTDTIHYTMADGRHLTDESKVDVTVNKGTCTAPPNGAAMDQNCSALTVCEPALKAQTPIADTDWTCGVKQSDAMKTSAEPLVSEVFKNVDLLLDDIFGRSGHVAEKSIGTHSPIAGGTSTTADYTKIAEFAQSLSADSAVIHPI